MNLRSICAAAIVCALIAPALFACLISADVGGQQMSCCTATACAPEHQNAPCLSKAGQGDSWKSVPEAQVRIARVYRAVESVASLAAFVPEPSDGGFFQVSILSSPPRYPIYKVNRALLI
jgi:hypothetical protein